jgi:hypothetical protein
MRARKFKIRPLKISFKEFQRGVLYDGYDSNNNWTSGTILWLNETANEELGLKEGHVMCFSGGRLYKNMDVPNDWKFNSSERFTPLPAGTIIQTNNYYDATWPIKPKLTFKIVSK